MPGNTPNIPPQSPLDVAPRPSEPENFPQGVSAAAQHLGLVAINIGAPYNIHLVPSQSEGSRLFILW